jgi:hypothetical protein
VCVQHFLAESAAAQLERVSLDGVAVEAVREGARHICAAERVGCGAAGAARSLELLPQEEL